MSTTDTDSRRILNAIHEGFFFVDVEADEILDANQEACNLLGYEHEELLSMGVSDIHPDEMDRLEEFAESAHADGRALASDLHCLRKDGRKIPIEASACHTELDGRSGLVVLVNDISTAQRQSHYLKVFERVLRHNLRNRMSVVLGRAEWIEDSVSDERVIEQSQTLCRTVDELIGLIEDIRTVQQSLRNEVDPAVESDCTAIVEELAAEVAADHPDATVSVTMPDQLCARSDERLGVALEQIVENAVVHNDSASPSIEIVGSADEAYGYAEIEIVDDGPGIPASEREAVTNPKETSPLRHGTGLGLWIASMIVFTLDGDITIADRDPEGTVVTLQLPLAASER